MRLFNFVMTTDLMFEYLKNIYKFYRSEIK